MFRKMIIRLGAETWKPTENIRYYESERGKPFIHKTKGKINVS
jgi:hypothetical protein